MSRVRVRLPACSCWPPEVCLPSLQHCCQCRRLVLLREPCCERGPRQEGGALALSGTSSLYGLDSVLKPEARKQLPSAWDSRAGVGVFCRIHVRARQDLACLLKIKVWVRNYSFLFFFFKSICLLFSVLKTVSKPCLASLKPLRVQRHLDLASSFSIELGRCSRASVWEMGCSSLTVG